MRVLTAQVEKRNIAQFNDLLRAQLVELRTQPGLLYVIEEWRTPADLFEWTGGRLTQPRLLPGTEALVAKLVITHYEALDLSPEDLRQRLLGDGSSGDAVNESSIGG
jgi:hypothetical protein